MLLEVKDLKTYFYVNNKVIKAVDGVRYSVDSGKTIGIVGESGSGKSVSSLSIMGIVPRPGKIEGGEIVFKGENLLEMSKEELRKKRGNEIAMIFQDPMSSLNPTFTIGHQIMEAILLHRSMNKKQAYAECMRMLDLVGIADAKKRMKQYPHEYSGGMRQRAMIAMALSCNPDLLIADEPTTALDVTIQKQILRLMKTLQKEFNTAIILITHDLGVVAEICDFVQVMYAGKCVEYASVGEVFNNAKHPYTKGLLNSQPSINSNDPLEAIDGLPPNLAELTDGCNFVERCKFAKDKCFTKTPATTQINPEHEIACFLYDDEEANA